MDWLYTISGFFVGFIVGVTGVGGGSLMTPLLVLVFGVAPATAVGTDLLYAALTKMGGIWAHSRRGTVDWKVVRLLAMGSLPAALLCMALLHYLALDEKHLKTLTTGVLSVALLLTALALLFKPWLQNSAPTCLRFSASSSMRWAISRMALPGSVIAVMRLPLRTKISIPSSSSSNFICLLTPGWDVYSAFAASEIFNPCREISFR